MDWLDVRREYESGEHSLWEICKHHGCGRTSLHQRRQEENWEQRRPAFPKAFGAGGKVNAAVRFEARLIKKLQALEKHLQPGEKLDLADPFKCMQTLAGAVEKILDEEAEKKRRDDGDGAGRDPLAQRLEALAARWDARDSGGTWPAEPA